MVELCETIVDRALNGVDLLIDFATLGEFGLEPTSVGVVGDEVSGCKAAREALAPTPRSDARPRGAPELVWAGGTECLEGPGLIGAQRPARS